MAILDEVAADADEGRLASRNCEEDAQHIVRLVLAEVEEWLHALCDASGDGYIDLTPPAEPSTTVTIHRGCVRAVALFVASLAATEERNEDGA
jgi:hypothetical protein